MNYESSPLAHVMKLFGGKDDVCLEFSKYVYQPQSLMDKRTTFNIYSKDISAEWLDFQFSNLKLDEELALHSIIKVDGKTFHIPMIDFNCSKEHLELSRKCLLKVLDRKVVEGLKFYSSGRSMHGYGSYILKPGEWQKFMGRILLANLPGFPIVVDTRWVGHRIISGYSSLRLSNNTGDYLSFPELIS